MDASSGGGTAALRAFIPFPFSCGAAGSIAGDDADGARPSKDRACWLCVTDASLLSPPNISSFIDWEGDDAGGGSASGRGDGGAGHIPRRAAAVSTKLSVRWWSAARDIRTGGGPCCWRGDVPVLIGFDVNESGFEGGRGGEGDRTGEETKSSKSSKSLNVLAVEEVGNSPWFEDEEEEKPESYMEADGRVTEGLACRGEEKSAKSSSSNSPSLLDV